MKKQYLEMPDEKGYFGEYGGEGIIPALESAHAVAHAMKIAKNMSHDETILVNLSGRGDKDADFVANYLSL